MTTPRPLRVDIPQSELDDLRDRLHRTRWPADPGNEDGRFGARRAWMEDLVGYWADEYDWRAAEAAINDLPNFTITIDGIPIHFVHARGTGPNPIPLVVSHGWPWTFWDLHQVIGPLADPAAHGGDPADSFDVVVPSLPGYGLSVPLTTTGVDTASIAALWVRLMRDVLGYERFGAEGGDWGAFISGQLGHAHAEHLIGVYLTLGVIPGLIGRRAPREEDFADDERWMVERGRVARPMIEAHVAVHRRDPQTLGYALADSPAGLGAWLWHRRQLWCQGEAVEVFGRDDLCTLSSLYWFGGSFASSIRLYAEEFAKPPVLVHDRERIIDAPTGFGIFPEDLLFVPRSTAERHTNLHRWSVLERGGHFAPAEQPGMVVDEVRAFFRPLR
jgi:pimeloyl-ACP methyl ester carboxylesterase